jgi:hypothetical protein
MHINSYIAKKNTEATTGNRKKCRMDNMYCTVLINHYGKQSVIKDLPSSS